MKSWKKILKWCLRLALILPVFWWVYAGFTGQLGVQPVSKLSTQTGYVTLTLFLINMAIGIWKALQKNFPLSWRWILPERRALGIATGVYLLTHVFFYLAKEGFLPKGFEQIFTKTYLTAAFGAAVIIWALALTSNNFSVRKLGPSWKTLHRGVHVAGILILVHLFLIEKANLVVLAAMTLPFVPFELWRLIRFLWTKVQGTGTLKNSR
jgi:sulfoxide reductase heme-binding subunit YedZ